MKPRSIHAGSAVLGALTVVLAAFAGSTASQVSPFPRVPIVGQVSVTGVPNPRTAVLVKEGSPYQVPPGQILVLTAIGNTDRLIRRVSLSIDSEQEMLLDDADGTTTQGELSIHAIPPGLTAAGGSTVEVEQETSQPSGQARAWGYLVDQ